MFSKVRHVGDTKCECIMCDHGKQGLLVILQGS